MTIAEFLRDRIAEDVAEIGPASDCDCDVIGLPLRHGVRCPVRMLAECDAKRRIVERYESEYGYDLPAGANEGRDWNERERDEGIKEALREVVLDLAQPSADHPDFDEAWRP